MKKNKLYSSRNLWHTHRSADSFLRDTFSVRKRVNVVKAVVGILLGIIFLLSLGCNVYMLSKDAANEKAVQTLSHNVNAQQLEQYRQLQQELELKQKKIEEQETDLQLKQQQLQQLEQEKQSLTEKIAALQNRVPVSEKKTAYLTFDDGPSENTDRVLDILAKQEIKATFFVVGYTDEASAARYRRIVAEGHSIGIHSFTHNYAQIYQSDESFWEDFYRLRDLIKDRTGVETKINRFPGGSSNSISKKYNKGIMKRLTRQMTEQGFSYFDWNVSSGDGSNIGAPERIKDNVLKGAKGQENIVVLMHDSKPKQTTVQALDDIINSLREKGYAFAPLAVNSPPIRHPVNN